jgi:hypothetical protein
VTPRCLSRKGRERHGVVTVRRVRRAAAAGGGAKFVQNLLYSCSEVLCGKSQLD